MNKLEYLKKLYGYLKNPNRDSLKLSMRDTHHKGVFSLVISGTEFGRLTRVFIANKKIKPFKVQLHNHRYPLRITVIKGEITHHLANYLSESSFGSISLSEFSYTSPLNGGNGLKYNKEVIINIQSHLLPIGSTIDLAQSDIHTMSCSKGSIWIVEELGFASESSTVLGVPFTLDGLYKEAKPFQINDNIQLVAKEIKKLTLHYELV